MAAERADMQSSSTRSPQQLRGAQWRPLGAILGLDAIPSSLLAQVFAQQLGRRAPKPANEVITDSGAAKPAIPVIPDSPNPNRNPNPENLSNKGKAKAETQNRPTKRSPTLR